MSTNNSGKGKTGSLFNSVMTRSGSAAANLNLTSKTIKGAVVLKLAQLVPNFKQVRQHFDEEALAELAADIKERGIIEPLIVREVSGENGTYEIIAGERRYRAAQQAGLEEVPVIVRELNDHDARFLMLAENLQRQNLDPRDEQRFFQTLQTEFNLSKTEIAKLVNKSRAYVSEMIDGKYPTLKTSKIDELNNISQSVNEQEADEARGHSHQTTQPARAFRYNTRVYRRVSNFFEETLAALDNVEFEEDTLGQIEQDVADAEAKLAALKAKLVDKKRTKTAKNT